MTAPISIFLDFNLPNATTWFYFSFLLAVALFFKFSRLLSIRNLDVVLLFLLAPGFLVVQAARPGPMPIEQQPALQIASLVGQGAQAEFAPVTAKIAVFAQRCGPQLEAFRWLWFGYLWLMVGSIYFFCRCLFDLALVQRPALAPNLQIGGLAWLAGALLICLLAVAYKQAERQMNPVPPGTIGPSGLLLDPPNQAVFAVAVLWQDWPAWGVASLSFACHGVVVLGLVFFGWRHFQDLAIGMAAATFYLMLPYTGQHIGQVHHVLPMALFIGALLVYRWPLLAGLILGVSTAATYFPVLALPLWLSFYRERGAGRFLVAFLVALVLGLLDIAFTLSCDEQLGQSVHLAMVSAAWQPWKVPDAEGFWTGIPWAYRIPVFGLYFSFVITTMFWPSPKNLAHVIALSAALFIGLQFWCADQGGAYVLWYVPLLLLMIFRPNLQDRVAPPISPETDWLSRSLRWCVRLVRRVIRMPEPMRDKNSSGVA
jgi:hypothetical protein